MWVLTWTDVRWHAHTSPPCLTRATRFARSLVRSFARSQDYNKREYVVQVLLKHVEGGVLTSAAARSP